MPFADKDFIKLNLPGGADFSVNGVTMTLDTAAQNALDEGGSRETALAILFGMLESDQLQSESVGRYAYARYKMRGSDYWRLRAGADALSRVAPSVIARPHFSDAGWREGCR